MYEELVLQHNLGPRRTKAVELQARLMERTDKGWFWICLIQEPYVVRGMVCGLGRESMVNRIELKSPDPKQSPYAIIYHHPKADITPCNQFTGRDVSTGIWHISQPDLENILLISLYWSREKVSGCDRVGSAESNPRPHGRGFDSAPPFLISLPTRSSGVVPRTR